MSTCSVGTSVSSKPKKKSFFKKLFSKKTKVLPIYDEDYPSKNEEDFGSTSSMSGLELESPTQIEINRVDNGYIVYAKSRHRGLKAVKDSHKQLVFGNVNNVAKYVKKELNKLEEEIKVEKLVQ